MYKLLICSDNGPSIGLCAKMPFKGYKTQMYEGGVRSHLIVWAPHFIAEEKRGTVNKGSVFSAMDLVPSLKNIYGMKNLPDLGMRDGKWKLVCDCDGSRPELYDLSVDRGETMNLVKERPELARRMADRAVTWRESILNKNITE